jgi:hypothetical protein
MWIRWIRIRIRNTAKKSPCMLIYLLKEEEEVGEPHGSADIVEDVPRTVAQDLQPGQLIPRHLADNFCKWVFSNKSRFYDFIFTSNTIYLKILPEKHFKSLPL